MTACSCLSTGLGVRVAVWVWFVADSSRLRVVEVELLKIDSIAREKPTMIRKAKPPRSHASRLGLLSLNSGADPECWFEKIGAARIVDCGTDWLIGCDASVFNGEGIISVGRGSALLSGGPDVASGL